MNAADRFEDGFLAGCATGNGYMEIVDAELKELRVRVELLKAACKVERVRADRAEAQAVKIAEENAKLLLDLRKQAAEGLRLISR